MNSLQIVWKNIIKQSGNAFLSIILTAFGVAILTVIVVVSDIFEKQLQNNSNHIDLVIGAKGSPLQLILSSVYHLDNPTGNIPLTALQDIRNNPMVALAAPLALGDNYKGHRIVGTDSTFQKLYHLSLKEGKWFAKDQEIVIGEAVATQYGLKTGDHIHSMHGLSEGAEEHADHPMTIVGILNKNQSVTDQLILTSIESVWHVHGIASGHQKEEQEDYEETLDAHKHHMGEDTEEFEHHHEEFVKTPGAELNTKHDLEITSILVQYQTPSAIAVLPNYINKSTDMQAASPALESARLFSLLDVGLDSLEILAYILIAIASISIFVNLYNALKQRKFDMAIMRTLGASKSTLFRLVILEGLFITIIGGIAGLLLAHLGLWIIQGKTSQSMDFISFFTVNPKEFLILIFACAIGIIAAIIPAVKAYKTSIAGTLSKQD